MAEPWTAERIRELREARGVSQAAFAAELGTTVTTVSRWENGHRMPRGLSIAALDRVSRKRG